MKRAAPNNFSAYSVGLVAASVCTSLPVGKAADRLNQEHPTGVGPWHLSDDMTFSDGKTKNGAACPDWKNHKHYLFNC